MTKKIFVIGTRNKKGIIKKTKWLPNRILITEEEYYEYLELKAKKKIVDAIKGIKN